VFDRGGPGEGVELGALVLSGVEPRAQGARAQLFVDNQVEPRLVRMCRAGLLPAPPAGVDCVAHVHTAGYRVTSSLDWDLTERATETLRESIASGLSAGCDCHDGTIVTIDPPTGEVRVYVPNANEGPSTGARPDIDQAIEPNEPGTAFALVTFLAWMDGLGKTPMSTLWDTNPLPLEDGSIANPRADSGSEGLITARAALAAMQAVAAVRATDEAGIEAVLSMAAKLGITTLASNFDPSWLNHGDTVYGVNVGSAGVNVRAIDLAFALATVANMGEMAGAPSLAAELDPGALESISIATGAAYDMALEQRLAFHRGDIRLPGSRELDPIVVLEVADRDGTVLFTQGEPERIQTVDSGSVWLLHSILSDCSARYLIWPCGGSNQDLALDFLMSDGQRVPAAVQFGRMPFPPDPAASLEVWMAGYSRYAATVTRLGNADNSLVKDGPAYGYAASTAVARLYKGWMAAYHDVLQSRGAFKAAEGFDALQPANVTFGPVASTSTEQGLFLQHGGDFRLVCDQTVEGWSRTDVGYAAECESVEIDTRDGSRADAATPVEFREARLFRVLPSLSPEPARALAAAMGIPVAPPE
jgi:membrane peptidoglycan carboxypeptidase